MSLKPYKTLLRAGTDQFVVNKSRFIGHGAPCETEEDALAFLDDMRRQFKDASHNCFAYIIGSNMGVMRYSDDGEPGGTAGLPIIEVMKARGVTNACVVVTRYFGGVLLGAGGLVRAYTQGAKIAIDAAGVGVMHPTARYLAETPYALLGRVEHALKDCPVLVEDKTFAENVTLNCVVRVRDEEILTDTLTRVTDGRCELVRMEEVYMPWREA